MKFHHVTWCSFAAAPYVTHSLHVAHYACSFSIVPWTLFQLWTFYRPWTLWLTHYSKLHHITWRSFAAAPYVTHALSMASPARSYRQLFSDCELPETGTLEYFTTLPDAASLLLTLSYVPWTLFFCPWTLIQLNSTNHELSEASTLGNLLIYIWTLE